MGVLFLTAFNCRLTNDIVHPNNITCGHGDADQSEHGKGQQQYQDK